MDGNTSNTPTPQTPQFPAPQTRGRGRRKPSVHTPDSAKTVFRAGKHNHLRTFTASTTHTYQSPHHQADKINTLSLFAGCGGLDLGFDLAGRTRGETWQKAHQTLTNRTVFTTRDSLLNTLYVNDNFPEALATYRRNRTSGSTVEYDSTDIRKVEKFPQANLVLGGFPCPGFSEGGPRIIDDPRNFLYLHFVRCIQQTQPEIFIAENVKGLLTIGHGKVFQQIRQDFENAGYTLYHQLVNAKDYCVPQSRERVIIVGVRKDIPWEYTFPQPHHTPDGNPIFTLDDTIRKFEHNPGPIYQSSYSPMFMSRNRKKRWNDVSFTIQASGRQTPIHPSGAPMKKISNTEWQFQGDTNRRISVKEAQTIQTFPEWYDFRVDTTTSNTNIGKAYKQIGNAVPVMLAYHIAAPIITDAHTIFTHLPPPQT